MLFITPSTGATEAKDYYTRQLAPSDYYTKDMAEMSGQWHGLGSKLLGLKGDVQQKDFFALADNLNPETGKNLTRNTQANRRMLYDFTFDAPKSVSLAYEVGGDERVLEALQSSVTDTMNEMEGAMMARVRVKGADKDRVTANMVWAGFTHRTTRPIEGLPDAQLHMHATVFNATYDEAENKCKAAQFSNLVRDKGYYQAAFHSRFAAKLSDLGYGIERAAEASRGVLRSEGFANVDTVERLLTDPEMQAKARHQVLWVDEAGLLSVKDMKRLFDVAKQRDARIILGGDSDQHNAVIRGDALRILEREAGIKTAELKEIRRQTDAEYRSAVKAISEGDMPGKDYRTRLAEGIAMLDDAGAIRQVSGDDRYRQIAADYAEVTATWKH